ncbi:hypothetical protein FMEAI12_4910030 [Parafrankia sp. Ea1.12]|nr:hypothetical protein FMEAI12_4910030 [Parafrankia sp. Ea1.12]
MAWRRAAPEGLAGRSAGPGLRGPRAVEVLRLAGAMRARFSPGTSALDERALISVTADGYRR